MSRVIVLLALAIASCDHVPTQPTALTSVGALERTLQQQGVTVARGSSLPSSAYPFFSVAGKTLVVNGEDVVVFEYRDSESTASDAARVSPTGTPIGQSQISWIDTPHFFRRDRLIVLYVGHSPTVLQALEGALGKPFAAGR